MSFIQVKQSAVDTELQGAEGLLKTKERGYRDKDRMTEKDRDVFLKEVDAVREELNGAT